MQLVMVNIVVTTNLMSEISANSLVVNIGQTVIAWQPFLEIKDDGERHLAFWNSSHNRHMFEINVFTFTPISVKIGELVIIDEGDFVAITMMLSALMN